MTNDTPVPPVLVDPESHVVEFLDAQPLTRRHEAEADFSARHNDIPGHSQALLEGARVTCVGAGGINSWIAAGLVRSGCGQVTIIDPDFVEPTNLARQLYFEADLGKPKALRLSQNLKPHVMAGARITGISLPFQDAVERYSIPTDVLMVGVDNNACRRACARWARERQIPAIFTMLSEDGGFRCISFLQGRYPTEACLWCALPDLDPEREAPCAASIVSGCFLAAALSTFFVHRAIMGWPAGVEPFNWRDVDMLGATPDRTGLVDRRTDCPVCGPLTPRAPTV
jgi:molybdopterin/thiamine biosynthesis adenylyltransferase